MVRTQTQPQRRMYDLKEGVIYVQNLTATNNLFNTTLHDRLGETQYVDALIGEKKLPACGCARLAAITAGGIVVDS